jgi:hypothetical protein
MTTWRPRARSRPRCWRTSANPVPPRLQVAARPTVRRHRAGEETTCRMSSARPAPSHSSSWATASAAPRRSSVVLLRHGVRHAGSHCRCSSTPKTAGGAPPGTAKAIQPTPSTTSSRSSSATETRPVTCPTRTHCSRICPTAWHQLAGACEMYADHIETASERSWTDTLSDALDGGGESVFDSTVFGGNGEDGGLHDAVAAPSPTGSSTTTRTRGAIRSASPSASARTCCGRRRPGFSDCDLRPTAGL